jgi:hypothetical protein
MSKEYQSREFCRDIECIMQKVLDNELETELNKACAELACKNCRDYKFHQWLKDNGYKIIKIIEDEEQFNIGDLVEGVETGEKGKVVDKRFYDVVNQIKVDLFDYEGQFWYDNVVFKKVEDDINE